MYSTFRNGTGLTPLSLRALLAAPQPDNRNAIDLGRAWLEGAKARPTEWVFPVYTAALAAQTQLQPAPWLEAVRERQLTEALGWSPDDKEYGGWGYSNTIPTKPKPGELAPPLVESNTSATTFAIDALSRDKAQLAAACPAALAFLDRRQNPDGGFVFIYDDPVRNKAGPAAEPGRFRSYGSTTADGLRVMILCGRELSDSRVQAARSWFEDNFSGTQHPGKFVERHLPDRDGLYYYWVASAARTLRLLPRDEQAAARAKALAEGVLARQEKDGRWENDVPTMRENEPTVATAMAVTALADARAVLAR